MAVRSAVAPVKYFAAVLWAEPVTLESAVSAMVERWGKLDFIGPDHPFDITDYYREEMGSSLQRRLLAFEELRSPEMLARAKLQCNDIEDRSAAEGRRLVNIDIGYLDHNKLVLASLKGAGQKIYLQDGVYADLVGRYKQGRYIPFEWTFPDFKGGRYDAELNAMRTKYLAQLRHRRATTSSEEEGR